MDFDWTDQTHHTHPLISSAMINHKLKGWMDLFWFLLQMVTMGFHGFRLSCILSTTIYYKVIIMDIT